MYCPKCATQNGDDVKFCRVCGTNLGLVSQALTGRLPEAQANRPDEATQRDYQKSIEDGVKSALMGVGFLFVAIALSFFGRGGGVWVGVWMLIPAFSLLGKGFAKIASVKYGRSLAAPSGAPAIEPARRTGELLPKPSEVLPPPVMMPPPSVTEGTTRNLDAGSERPTERQLPNIQKQGE